MEDAWDGRVVKFWCLLMALEDHYRQPVPCWIILGLESHGPFLHQCSITWTNSIQTLQTLDSTQSQDFQVEMGLSSLMSGVEVHLAACECSGHDGGPHISVVLESFLKDWVKMYISNK